MRKESQGFPQPMAEHNAKLKGCPGDCGLHAHHDSTKWLGQARKPVHSLVLTWFHEDLPHTVRSATDFCVPLEHAVVLRVVVGATRGKAFEFIKLARFSC